MKVDLNEIRMRRGIFLLPNLLTTCCLFGGFYAIIAAIDGNFERATVAIFVAMVFDGLDGRVARLMGTETAFGKEFDSLADMVAFGLAPAVVCYQWGVARIAEYGSAWGRFGWIAAFFFAAATAMRLARFNARAATQDKRYFEGLPSPSGAAIVAAFVATRARPTTSPACRASSSLSSSRLLAAIADGQQVSVSQLQGPGRRRARALFEAAARAARDRHHRDQSAGRGSSRCSASMRLSGPIGWSWLKLRRRPRDAAAGEGG